MNITQTDVVNSTISQISSASKGKLPNTEVSDPLPSCASLHRLQYTSNLWILTLSASIKVFKETDTRLAGHKFSAYY